MITELLDIELQTSKTINQIISEVKTGLRFQTLTYPQAVKDKELLETLEPQNIQQIEEALKVSEKLTKELPIIEARDYAQPKVIYFDKGNGWISWQQMNKIHNKKYYPTIPIEGTNQFLKLKGKKPKFWNGDYELINATGNILVAKPILNLNRLEKVYTFYSQDRYMPKDEEGNIKKRGFCWIEPSKVVQSKTKPNELVARINDALIFIRNGCFQGDWDGDIRFIRLDHINHGGKLVWASGKKEINEYKRYIFDAYKYHAS
ncbi:hypothetical protein JXA48_03000 [Candidatus Woesearchaeota archaeon]|nr:hypothetical protein [Candidatus Woesearchaeota archaeon]